MATPAKIDETGSCLCRGVAFKVSANVMFNALCHCKACSHARGMSPVHLIGIQPAEGLEITQGSDLLTTTKGYGKMRHTFCSKCGSIICQYPEGADFRAIVPTNFHIADGVNCKLPDKYLPQAHTNYENRHYDWYDPLPKFKAFPPNMVDNAGNDIPS